jgi:hypothetical protein
MAHTFDTSLRFTGSSSPVTANYTCGTGTTVLVLGIIVGGSTARAGGAPTYNGVAMTAVYTGIMAASSPETNVDMYYLLNPPTGSAYQISIPNTGTKSLYCMASSYKAASGNTSALDVQNNATNTSTNPTCSVTTTADAVLIACVGDGAQTWSPTGRTGTQLGDYDDGNYGDGHQYYIKTGAGSQAMAWTFGTSEDWAEIVAAFKEVVAPKYLAGVINGVASVSGFSKITKTIQATSQGMAGVTGFVKILKTIAGVIAGTSTVSGFTGIIKKLIVSVSGVSTVVSNLTVIIVKYLQGVVQGLSSVSGIAKIYRGLQTSGAGVSTVSAFAKVLKTFQASVAGTSNVSGIAKIFRGLKASVSGMSSVSGVLGRLYSLSGQIIGIATVTGSALITRGLKAVSNGISQVLGSLTVIIQKIKAVLLSAIVSGTSVVSGFVSVFKIALGEKIKVVLQVSGREGKLIGLEAITQKEPSKLELIGENKTIRLVKREVN